jgi:Immunoglobulin domain
VTDIFLFDGNIPRCTDSPRILTNPQTAAGEEGEAVTLHCEIDSNPPTTYTWTKGDSRQVGEVEGQVGQVEGQVGEEKG